MTSTPHASVLTPAQTGPLAGLYVVITQAEERSAPLVRLLYDRGATPVFYPCIDVAPPRNMTPLDDAIRHAVAGKFDWLTVTTPHAAESLADRLAAAELTGQALAGLRVAAVGPDTVQAVSEKLGLSVEAVLQDLPKKLSGDAIGAALAIQPGQRVFLPQSAQAKPDLADALMAAGADVTVVDAYRPVLAEGGDDVPTQLWRGRIDVIAFANPATIRYFRKRLDLMGGNLGMLQDVVVACMDSATADAARQYGLRVRVMPTVETEKGLVEALVGYFGERKTASY